MLLQYLPVPDVMSPRKFVKRTHFSFWLYVGNPVLAELSLTNLTAVNPGNDYGLLIKGGFDPRT